MQQRFAATDRNYARPHFAEPVDSTEHFLGWNRVRNIVKLVAVSAGEIAPPGRNDVYQQRVARGDKSLRYHANRPQPAMGCKGLASNFLCKFHHLHQMNHSPRKSTPICISRTSIMP